MAKYSYTQIRIYEQCPQKYKFRYLDGIQAEKRTIESFLGGCVHQTLNKLYGDLQSGHSETCEQLLASYKQYWDSQYSQAIKVVRANTDVRSYFENGRRMIESYYRRFHPFRDGSTLGLELEVSFPMAADTEFHGFVDRVTQKGPHSYEIHDYKTSRRLPSITDIKRDLQLPLYELAVRHIWSEAKNVTLVWHYLAFDREFRNRRSPDELEAAKQNALQSIQRVEAARWFPTRESQLCDWCEYYAICPAKQKGLTPSVLGLTGRHEQSSRLSQEEISARKGSVGRWILSAFRGVFFLLLTILRFILARGESGRRRRMKQWRRARR